jgi:hypothetical protein
LNNPASHGSRIPVKIDASAYVAAAAARALIPFILPDASTRIASAVSVPGVSPRRMNTAGSSQATRAKRVEVESSAISFRVAQLIRGEDGAQLLRVTGAPRLGGALHSQYVARRPTFSVSGQVRVHFSGSGSVC